jgi:DNA invertase Pin-like site-specific DNA recombinase
MASKAAFVSYLRVSTDKQGIRGLGIEAQRQSVEHFVNGHGHLLHEYVEVESGKRNDRPQLAKAIEHAKVTGSRLVVAKIDRLARDLGFIVKLRDSGVSFIAADMPDANEFTVNILAAFAEHERKMISARTKAALGAAKKRGVKLGSPRGAKHLQNGAGARGLENGRASIAAAADQRAMALKPILEVIIVKHKTLRAIAAELNARHITTPRGGKWWPKSTAALLRRLDRLSHWDGADIDLALEGEAA